MGKFFSGWFMLVLTMILASCAPVSEAEQHNPIHLDDIHFIVTDEDAAVAFFKDHFGGREMAHPGDRFDLVRFISLKWQEPTITITPIGPYPDLPAERNQRWLDTKVILPQSEKQVPIYGARWLALSTESLSDARKSLLESGVELSEDSVSLPNEPEVPAFSVYGPDGTEIVVVERPEKDFGEARYAIDHIQFLVPDAKAASGFFETAFKAKTIDTDGQTTAIQVADALLKFSEPEVLGISRDDIVSKQTEDELRIGLGHLGFLYADIHGAVEEVEANGIQPIFQPQRYVYQEKPTVYTFTAFSLVDGFTIEMVQADGRIGPHSYYIDQNR